MVRAGELPSPHCAHVFCSPGHHRSPLRQLGLLQSVSWAGALCGEGAAPGLLLRRGPPAREVKGFLGAILGLRDQQHILGLPTACLLDVALPWISLVLGQWPVQLAWGSVHFSRHPRDASSGDWDTESCQTLETQAAHTRCQCQHLSTFAVLAQPPKDLVSGRKSLGQAGEGAPGLLVAISDSLGRDLGDPASAPEQVHLWDCA